MRTLRLLGAVAAVWVLAAVVSPWLAAMLAAGGWRLTFARVYDRVFELLLVAAVVIIWRRLDLGTPRQLGLARPRWAVELARGFGAGVAGLALALVVCAVFGAIAPELRFAAAKTLQKAVLGAVAAIAIGAGEEVLFRGVLLHRMVRDAGRVTGVVLTSLLYAVVHAIRIGGTRGGAVTWWSGIERSAALLAPFFARDAVPTVAGLFGLGLLLAVARLRTGSLWVSIGIHAAWVSVFRVGRLFFAIRHEPVWLIGPGWPPLVGGVAGWLAIAVAAGVLSSRRRRAIRGG